ncbi:MAG: SCO family protein [Candidatus Eremiobacteraeota bacterium]|nr:SCO family protein [Candidatus Eremiobacteraeota bacterium]
MTFIRPFAALAIASALAGCNAAHGHAFEGTPLSESAAPAISLTSSDGSAWTLESARGKVVALFFGYTHCADTCPLTLAKLAAAIVEQGSAASDFEIVFVTVDPQRDTPTVLKRYIAKFPGAPIVALTGSVGEVHDVERAYHVWAQKIPGARRGAGRYDEAHSSVVYLIDRAGRERVLHNDDDDVSSFASDLRALRR